MNQKIAGKPIGQVGFGGGPLGVHGFGVVDLPECRRAVRYALERDITFFDTSDAYGKGVGEEQLALALDGVQSKAVIATKGGIRFHSDNSVFYDSSPVWLEDALNSSLKRLNTDYIDLYQLHYWDRTTPLEDVFGTLSRFREEGKIGGFGVSNLVLDPSVVGSSKDLSSYSFDYSMVSREELPRITAMAEAFPTAAFLPTGVLAQGLLSCRYDKESQFGKNDRRVNAKYVNFNADTFSRLESFLKQLGSRQNSPVSLAIAWAILAQPNSVPLVGIKSRSQVDAMVMARDLTVTGSLDFSWVDKALVALG